MGPVPAVPLEAGGAYLRHGHFYACQRPGDDAAGETCGPVGIEGPVTVGRAGEVIVKDEIELSVCETVFCKRGRSLRRG